MSDTVQDKGRTAVEERAKRLERLEVQYVPIADLEPNDYNPNRQDDGTFELLKRSMRDDGFTQPIVVQRDTNTIVDGEHRWRVAHDLGFEEIPVVYVDMSPEQMRMSTLRHNRARGSEDLQLTAEVLRDLEQLDALDWAQDGLMMDDTELQRLLEDVAAPEALAGDEWSDSWEPVSARDGRTVGEADPDTETVENRDAGSQGVQSTAAATPEAVAKVREREKQLQEARNEEERERIQQEKRDLYRLSLLFSGEEAALVRHVLRPRAAERLVTILEDWVDRHPEDAPPEDDG